MSLFEENASLHITVCWHTSLLEKGTEGIIWLSLSAMDLQVLMSVQFQGHINSPET